MKRALSILLAVIIISQMMVNVSIGIYFHLNKEYIAHELCINKSNPAMHCQGHCYLSKQLKKAEQREKQSAQSFKDQGGIVSDYNRGGAAIYHPPFTISNFVVFRQFRTCSDNRNSLIKPPLA